MILLLTGKNSFALHEAFTALRAEHNRDAALSANTIVLDGARLGLGELRAAALTVPFLAEYRLVRVDGLGARLQSGGRGRARALGEWDGLPDLLAQAPPTTLLVFVDGELRQNNPLRVWLTEAGEVRDFPEPRPDALVPWVRQRARGLGLQLTPAAERQLIELVGKDLWALAGELEKLSIYAGADTVDERVVASLAATGNEAGIFQLVDAVADGRPDRALRALDPVRGEEDPRRIVTMLARQFRMIAAAREIVDGGGGPPEVAQALHIPPWLGRRVVDQARRFDQAAADAALRRIVDCDAAIQNYWEDRPGGVPQDLAVELLVADLADPSGRRRPA